MDSKIFTDQIGHSFKLTKKPKRIISLVPSQTELLFYLGLENDIVGCSKFCIHPIEKISQISKIGGTKKFNFEMVDNLNPDLIIANKEENYKEGIEILQAKYPVWTSDIFNMDDALEMIAVMGRLTQTENKTTKLCASIEQKWQNVKGFYSGSVLYFIWKNPYMLATKNTFIFSILNHLGFEELIDKNRYPELNTKELANYYPDFIFLSSEPYPFKEKHIPVFRKIFPEAKILLVNGKMFSWYGSRLLQAIDYFKTLAL